MNHLLFHIFAFFFHLLRDVVHFVRFGRPARTFSWPGRRPASQSLPCPTPQAAPQTVPQRDPMAELALLKAENRATMREANALRREMNERRRREREAARARARGELPPAKPRKPRKPQSKSQPKTPPIAPPKTPPQALPEAPPAVASAPKPNPLPQTHFQSRPIASPAIPSRPKPSHAAPPRTLFKTLSKIFAAPLRILKAVLIALPSFCVRFLPRRRPPSDGPPAARPAAPTLQNRAA